MSDSKKAQIQKYGGKRGYSKEMARRRSLVKTYHLKDNPNKAREMAAKRWAHAKEIPQDTSPES